MKFPRINYSNILVEYENRLGSMERGFALDEEFLDLWVPDDDVNKSIYYLFESASIRKQPGLILDIDQKTMQSLDGEGLLHSLAAFGKVGVDKSNTSVVITVAFGEKGESSAEVDEIRGLANLHLCYRDRLIRDSRELRYKYKEPIDLQKGTFGLFKLVSLEVPYEDGTVIFIIEPKHGLVYEVRYKDFSDNDVTTRMLELLCRIVKGFSLQEIAEHGVIRLENYLRDITKPAPVRGLITPENAGKYFASLNQFVRKSYKAAKAKFNIPFQRNTSEEPISEDWLALSEQERIKRLNESIGTYLKENNIKHVSQVVLGIRLDIQVYVDFEGYKGEGERRFLVKNIEKYLKSVLEARLELYLPTAEDKLKRDKKSTLFKENSVTIKSSSKGTV